MPAATTGFQRPCRLHLFPSCYCSWIVVLQAVSHLVRCDVEPRPAGGISVVVVVINNNNNNK